VEEYLRMVLDDGHLTGLVKSLRHDLTAASALLPGSERFAARDTLGDVGRDTKADDESHRSDTWHVAQASFSRVAQGLRVLEEYGKLLNVAFAQQCEELRYRLYTVEKATAITSSSRDRLEGVRLCAIVSGQGTVEEFCAMVEELVADGVGMIQLRDKRLSDKELFERAGTLVALTRGSSTVTIINDRPDIAAAVGAGGVHMGQDDLPVAAARRIVGPRALVGLSTHSIEQARSGVLSGADYLGVGPTFVSSTKPFEHFPGLNLLRQVAAEISLPAFAIGGIGVDNLESVLSTGVARVAVAGALETPGSAKQLLERLRDPPKLA
jgi:thiamine-phosphate pyrophosphorylase